jgi:hypothetical protein
MQDVTAETAKKTSQNIKGRTLSGENTAQNTALDYCYRQIGISAVAAAARYQGTGKNPAYAPVTANRYEPAEDAAA